MFALTERTNGIYDGTSIGYYVLKDFSITISRQQYFTTNLVWNIFRFPGRNFLKEGHPLFSVKVTQRVNLIKLFLNINIPVDIFMEFLLQFVSN